STSNIESISTVAATSALSTRPFTSPTTTFTSTPPTSNTITISSSTISSESTTSNTESGSTPAATSPLSTTQFTSANAITSSRVMVLTSVATSPLLTTFISPIEPFSSTTPTSDTTTIFTSTITSESTTSSTESFSTAATTSPLSTTPITSPTTKISSTTTTPANTPCSLPCTNGMCFIDPSTKNSTCQCNTGYELHEGQPNCFDINECETLPQRCEQDCVNTVGSYVCSCFPGFEVNSTNIHGCVDINECLSKPCKNNGTCQNLDNAYSCQCARGWTGTNCDQDINECLTSPCKHGSSCNNNPGSFTCECLTGWTGLLCSENVNDCMSNPCMHGQCVDGLNQFFCECAKGWTGNLCDKNVDDCKDMPLCLNDGTCNDLVNGVNCTCAPGFMGEFCEYNIDDCTRNTCQNNATCVDGIGNFTCRCVDGWSGDTCSIDNNECEGGSFRCHRTLGVCINTPGSYSCQCIAGYAGDGIECFENRLFDYGPEVNDRELKVRLTDFVSPSFTPPYGFPFSSKFYQQLYFSDNGLIVFKEGENPTRFAFPNPIKNGFTSSFPVPMVAVFWDDSDFSSDNGTMYFQEYDFTKTSNPPTMHAQDLRERVKAQIRANFSSSSQPDLQSYDPTWILKITWKEAPAIPARNNLANTNTFQAVLNTDGVFSFCLIMFKDGGMLWRPETRDPNTNNALMGFHSGTKELYYNHPLSRGNMSVRYRPDQAIGLDTGLKGRWAYRLENNSLNITNPKRQCLEWVRNEIALSPLAYFTSCPCSYQQGVFDSNYIDGNLISLYYSFDVHYVPGARWILQSFRKNRFGGGVRCYYNRLGALMSGWYERHLPTPWNPPVNEWSLYVISNNQRIDFYDWMHNVWLPQERQHYLANELEPYRSCCQKSGESRLCELYQQRRPRNQCAFYRPPTSAFLIGDPHITTLDNVSYTFNGLGEFTVLHAFGENGSELILQGRTDVAGTNGTFKATSFVALVAHETGGAKVQWILGDNSTAVFLNDEAVNVTDVPFIKNSTSIQRSGDSGIMASFPSGISVNVSGVYGALSFIILLPETFINRTQGLLGVFNKDPTDDFQPSNGTVLPFNGTLPPESTIFYEFGMTWKTTPSTSLFSYSSSTGESWYTFNNNSFVPLFYEDLVNQTSPENLAAVESTCGGQKDCIFDTLSTGNMQFGLATRTSTNAFIKESQELKNFPPNINSVGQINCKLNETVFFQLIAVDFDKDPIDFNIVTNSSDLSITSDGNFTWSPRSSEPVFGVVSASDGKASSVLLLNLTLCNCSVHSTCLYNQTTLSINGRDGSTYQVAGCLCEPGYTGTYCAEDFNACADDPCHPGVNCTDFPPPSMNFTCGPCPAHLKGDGTKCYDENECLAQPRVCDQTCENTLIGYQCSCTKGYSISTTNSSQCEDINECALNSSLCATNGHCVNTPGSYMCRCNNGFQGDGDKYCYDIFECRINNDPCRLWNNSICNNTEGSFNCICKSGYAGDNCTDINECSTNNNTCHSDAECINTDGSYDCRCKTGFAGSGKNCYDIDECGNNSLNNCDSASTNCTNTPGSFYCTCARGYTGNGTHCNDIDECLSNPCQELEKCINKNGTFSCECQAGYRMNNGTCTDIDECTEKHPCPVKKDCANTLGSYICSCKTGYETDVDRDCSDINECDRPDQNNCSKKVGLCQNYDGGFQCQCQTGYTGNGVICIGNNNTCETDICGVNRTCHVTAGHSIICVCYEGFIPDGTSETACVNINECNSSVGADNRTPCDPLHGLCMDTVGSYTCACKHGYELEPDGRTCKDINECQSGTPACLGNSICVNTEGSHNCTCSIGYTYNGSFCLDIDECQHGDKQACGEAAVCHNTVGSYSCSCIAGYKLVNKACVDVDECVSGNSPCPLFEICENLPGSFKCVCQDGYNYIGQQCVAVNCKEDACTPGYCKNEGVCANNVNCTATCHCPIAHRGDKCQYGASYVGATFKEGTPKAEFTMWFNNSDIINDTESFRDHVSNKLEIIPNYYDCSVEKMSIINTTTYVNSTARFNYTTSVHVFSIYNGSLEKKMYALFTTNKRMLEGLQLLNVTEQQILSWEELLKAVVCQTALPGYHPFPVPNVGIQCRSPCAKQNDCLNGGKCENTETGPVCFCNQDGLYHYTGTKCENLTITSPAFFGILFGSLGGLLLILIAIIVFWRHRVSGSYKIFKSGNSDFGDEESSEGNLPYFKSWKTQSGIEDSQTISNYSDIIPSNWSPVLYNISNTKITLPRPSIIEKSEWDTSKEKL
ncbi:unnamed protein product, partial [Lampetra fluviatilis]